MARRKRESALDPDAEFMRRSSRPTDQSHLAYDDAYRSEDKNLRPHLKSRLAGTRGSRTRVR